MADIKEKLIEEGLVNPQDIQYLEEMSRETGIDIVSLLISNELVGEYDIYRIYAELKGVQFISEIAEELEKDVFMEDGKISQYLIELCQENIMLPLKRGRIAVADLETAQKYILVFGYRTPCIAPPGEILLNIEKLFIESVEATGVQSAGDYLDILIRRAILERASDIHLEPGSPACYVRFRIDGDLVHAGSYPIEFHEALVNVIMMRATGNPHDERVFEDSSFTYRAGNSEVFFRVAKSPTVRGPSVVMRILKQDLLSRSINDLGFNKEQLKVLNESIRKPYGIILATGPTGSGKSTTLHALLREIRGMGRKILSIEDPVEIQAPFIQQVNVNPAAEITFDTAIRHFLRQDPDVILVGEIRDKQTARTAFDAALTGHLVLASVHANTIMDSFLRLDHLGIPFREMSTIVCIISQRLKKKKCERDRETCKKCRVCSGYYGRYAVGEIFIMNERVRETLINDRLPVIRKEDVVQ